MKTRSCQTRRSLRARRSVRVGRNSRYASSNQADSPVVNDVVENCPAEREASSDTRSTCHELTVNIDEHASENGITLQMSKQILPTVDKHDTFNR